MLIAYQTAVAGLIAGRSAESVLNEIKSQASFSGFRSHLVQWLEYLDIHHRLGLGSAHELWSRKGERYLHPTSAIRYPVLIGGKNYNGTSPSMTRHPALRRYLREVLAPELAEIPNALVVPLGVRVDEAIALLIDEGRIESARCLVGFPHPSGSNGHKTKQWTANRAKLKRKANAWFS